VRRRSPPGQTGALTRAEALSRRRRDSGPTIQQTPPVLILTRDEIEGLLSHRDMEEAHHITCPA